MSPREECDSATGRGILITDGVDVPPEADTSDARCTHERGSDGIGWHEHALTQRAQLSNGYAVARDDKRLPSVQVTHDSTAIVAKFSLSDPSTHFPTL
jgi:hypothetical protein